MPPSTPVARLEDGLPGWRPDLLGLPAQVRARLAGRAIWVTGAGTGYGRAVATCLALLDARVVLTGRRVAKLTEAAEDIVSAGSRTRAEVMPLDLTDASEVEAAVSRLRQAGITGLVHCAAIPQAGASGAPLLEGNGFPQMFASNVLAAWLAARACVEAAAAAGAVRVVLYSSTAGWHFTPGFGPYNVSKAALNSLGGCLADEAAARHPGSDIQINVLDPGEARTEMNRGSTRSAVAAVPMTLALLGQPAGGPNGYFFHADGRHLSFASRPPWPLPLLAADR